ncbi:MAG: tRNA delta(2)-isopentenylpyrophosphate transferase [Parcubacteria group bacterium GW2011_GWC1_38_6]|nr:MAG: tRNA delta(2)-isopentenylpyrophosphate transferase [Parcubacteria group bacterium GW2011_GWC1_38_6]
MKNASEAKIIVILGPTASGKSDLAVKIALRLGSGQARKKFRINGAEIISADSRQVYKGLDIGSGKITQKEMMDIPHHLLSIASPKRKFTVAQYKKLAIKAINKIIKRNKIPIICGGTGFYIQAIVDGISIPEVKPDWKLRKKLEKEKTSNLFLKLKKLDPKRARTIDSKNKRRLIRAIEIVLTTKRPVQESQKNPLPHKILIFGIKKDKNQLKKLIKTRLKKRLKLGMIAEVKNLRKQGCKTK